MDYVKNILITGGAGFIGSHVVRLFVNKYPDYKIINLDDLTYAGNLENLSDIEDKPNYEFVKGSIVNAECIQEVFKKYRIDSVIHLAAESHVDRSIIEPNDFIQTNIVGTVNLLNAARAVWHWNKTQPATPEPYPCADFRATRNPYPVESKKIPQGGSVTRNLFHHISTDEVFGSLDQGGFFTEQTPYDPRSPYSASKASSDHLVRAYFHTYKLPVVISNCSNNYGPYQFPEKLIPLAINNIKNNKPIPVYGKGENIRDWLFVEDHANAVDLIFHHGKTGETYNVGGNNQWKNIDLIYLVCEIMDRKLKRKPGESAKLITFVKDRPGHDKRYAIDPSKLQNEMGWKPCVQFEQGLAKTIDWYLANEKWLDNVTSGQYQKYYQKQYIER